MISGSYHPGDLFWFNAGSKGFEPREKISETTPESIRRSASAASCVDWDKDGDLDILVGNIEGNVYWIENQGTKTEFKFGARQPIHVGDSQLRVSGGDAHPLAVDWDNDGILDLVVGCGDGTIIFCKGAQAKPSGPPTFKTALGLEAAGKPVRLGGRVKISVVDWNEDGHLDLLAGDYHYENGQMLGNVYAILREPSVKPADPVKKD